MNFSPYDRLETLRFSSMEILQQLSRLEKEAAPEALQAVAVLKDQFSQLSTRWFQVCEHFTEEYEQAHNQSAAPRKHNRLHTQPRKATVSADKRLNKSFNQVQALCKRNLTDLQSSLTRQKQRKRTLQIQRTSHLRAVEAEMANMLDSPLRTKNKADDSLSLAEVSALPNESGPQFSLHDSCQSSSNYDAEFDRLMGQLGPSEHEADLSKVSLDKTHGKWLQELESDDENESVEVSPQDMQRILRSLEQRQKLRDFEQVHQIHLLLNDDTERAKLGVQLGKILLKNQGYDVQEMIPQSRVVTAGDSKNYNAPFASPRRFTHIKKKVSAPEPEQQLMEHSAFHERHQLTSSQDLPSFINIPELEDDSKLLAALAERSEEFSEDLQDCSSPEPGQLKRFF